ncbi:MAG: hypothetical protein M5U14_19215 [Acidimicrobiia bacterium]|nr:hypothetical protein [Acidimicrobiia bacterium]
MTIVLASIPSPSSGDIGPIHVYGLLLAVGVLVAAKVADVRWRRGGHQPPTPSPTSPSGSSSPGSWAPASTT